MEDPAKLKAEILRLTREYSVLMHAANRPAGDALRPAFAAGPTTVPYAARVFDDNEVAAAVSATLDFWLTLGPEGKAFEAELARILGVRSTLLVNSGSSANLVALSALTSHKLPPALRLRPGDEVITVAAGFPTTVAPIVQQGAVPVFIDSDPVTGNARAERLEEAFVPGKTKAVVMAHTLGNPFDLGTVLEFCRRHRLWLVEDNCDALGSTYTMPLAKAKALGLDHLIRIAESGANPSVRLETVDGLPAEPAAASGGSELYLTAPTGSWGDLSTQSFYPPHHLTMGEGGAVNIVSKAALRTYAESFRDWGRDCWCASGMDNTCGRRFEWQLGELPRGYDHKYIYSHLGYNLKPLDVQAAIGREQLKKLPAFIAARKSNWEYLRAALADLGEFFEFSLPTHATAWSGEPAAVADRGAGLRPTRDRRTAGSSFGWDQSGCRSDPSWFGFMLRVRPGAPFSNSQLGRHLDENKVGNRMLFGGNLVRQPAFVQLRKDRPEAFRVLGELTGADELMHRALFLGTYPGLSTDMLDHVISVVRRFCLSR